MASRSGQSLIESCIVIAILCLVLFGTMQISQCYMAQEVLTHAALCGARARAVGLNDFMVQNTARIASIPLAGQLVQPSFAGDANSPILSQQHISGAWNTALNYRGVSSQVYLEKAEMPYYLGSGDEGEAASYLDYQLDYLNQDSWTMDSTGKPIEVDVQQSVHLQRLVTASWVEDAVSVAVSVTHDFPLNFAFHRAFFPGVDVLQLSGKATVEKHYDLYLQ